MAPRHRHELPLRAMEHTLASAGPDGFRPFMQSAEVIYQDHAAVTGRLRRLVF
jgi:hypothetical protein